MTRRGPWYETSWKGELSKFGGVAMNIGVHFFDLLLWLFGSCRRTEEHLARPDKMAGFLELDWADVTWFLSVDRADLPPGYFEAGRPAYRSLAMHDEEIEFSEGFTDLHTAVYADILAGGGYGLADAKPSVELVYALRGAELVNRPERAHPALVGALTAPLPAAAGGTLPPPPER